jgi:hypothetical protein
MTAEQLTELERLEREATPGPWWGETAVPTEIYAPATDEILTSGFGNEKAQEDAELVIALRNHAPALIAAARERDELRALAGKSWGALNFILAFYEPQNYLDTEAWKNAEAGGRHTHKALREWLDAHPDPPKPEGEAG